jgi:hypothetical protein
MYCKNCGNQNDDSAVQCAKCGQPLRAVGMPPGPAPSIPNYLVQSILVTLFCCLPLGVVAIVYAAQVNGKVQAGDIQGAMDASKNAKMWCWISFGLGLAVIAIQVIITIGAGLAGQR